MTKNKKERVLRYDKLVRLQGLSLDDKIIESKKLIKEWYEYWNGQVFVSYSGGRDSSVVLHMVRSMYPAVLGVFIDTGVEFPENCAVVEATKNITTLVTEHTFLEVVQKYGYPVSLVGVAKKIEEVRTTKSEKLRRSHLEGDYKIPAKWMYLLDAPFKVSGKCEDVLKRRPRAKFEKKMGMVRFTGVSAYESRLRLKTYLRYGSNCFDLRHPVSKPLSFWLRGDVIEYIKRFKVPESAIYLKGFGQTGCMYCAFGLGRDDPNDNRFMKLKRIHPKLYEYGMEVIGLRKVLEYMGYEIERKQMSLLRGIDEVSQERCDYCNAVNKEDDDV